MRSALLLFLALAACSPTAQPPLAPLPPPNAARGGVAVEASDCSALTEAFPRAKALAEIAGAALATPIGPERRAIERWIKVNGADRAESLRAAALDLKGEVRETARAQAALLDALAGDARKAAPMEEHQAALVEALRHLPPLCPMADFAKPARAGPTPESIQVVVRAYNRKIQTCYEEALTRTPNLTARIGIAAEIGPLGTPENVTDAGSDVHDAPFVACVQDVFRAMRFARPQGGRVTFVYPFIFQPEPDRSKPEK